MALFTFAPLAVLALLLGVLAFAAVLRWIDRASSEREAFYQYEFRKKLLEHGAQDTPAMLDLLREEERILQRRRRERLKLTGIAAVAGGAASLRSKSWARLVSALAVPSTAPPLQGIGHQPVDRAVDASRHRKQC